MPLNKKIYCFLSNRTGDVRFNNPIFMEQTQPKDNSFSTRGDMLQASDLEPRAERHNFPWRKIKIKIIKCEWCTVETSVNNSFTRERVFYRFNERFVSNRTEDTFFDKVFGTLSCNNHLASDMPMERFNRNTRLLK